MQQDQNLPYEPIDPLSNIKEEFLDWNFLEGADDFPCDQHVAVQHDHEVYGDDADCLPDMWKNWLNISSEAQSLDNVLGVPLSACISPLPNCSSQTSANFLPCSNTRGPELLETCFIGQHSPLSSALPDYAANEHNLHSLNANNHANDTSPRQLDVGNGSVSKPAAPYSSPSEMNVMAPLSPPLIDVKTCQAPSYFKATSSSCKKKQAEVAKIFRNNSVRTNKEVETCRLAETIEDGYIWHKYGQKSIKNRMHPRGYFKCAHPNCPIKKRTELAPDMQGSVLITYIGEHNHMRPLMTCREVL